MPAEVVVVVKVLQCKKFIYKIVKPPEFQEAFLIKLLF